MEKRSVSDTGGVSPCSISSAITRRARALAFSVASSELAPYTVTPGSSGISAIHRPSVSRSNRIVSCICRFYHLPARGSVSRPARPSLLRQSLHRNQHGLLVLAIRIRTLQHRPGLQPLLHHVRAPALGTLLLPGIAPSDEVAIRPAVAAVERLAALGAPLHHLAIVALRALHADGLLLHMLARRIIAASGKLAETAGLQHHVTAAHRALLVELHIGLLLRAADGFGGLAVRVSGTGEEGAEAALLQHHGTAAVFAVFFIALLSQVHLVHIRQIDGELARVSAIGISGAGDEAAVFAPFDHQGLAALLAVQAGGLLHPLDVGHVLFGVLQVLVEPFVELADSLAPGDLPRFNLVEFLLHAGGVLDIEDVVEVLEQQAGDDSAQFGGVEPAALLLHILALLNGGEDGGVGGRTADAVGFPFLHQRGLVVARRRLGEMLLGRQAAELEMFALGHGGEPVFHLLVFFVGLVLAFFVDL